MTWIRKNRFVLIAFVGMAVLLTAAGSLRYRNYWAGAFDMGVFDQAIWLLSKGHAYVPLIGRNIFADHMSLILLAFAGMYKIWASPYVLIGVQAIALASTVFPMGKLAEHEGLDARFGVVATLVSAPILQAATFDFHPWTLATPAIAWALLEARRGYARKTALASAIVLLCRPDLICALVAIAIVARSRRVRVVLAGAVVVGAAMLLVPTIAGEAGRWAINFPKLGTSPGDALRRPSHVASVVFAPGSLAPLFFIFLPVLFLPLFSLRWTVALVVAALPIILDESENAHKPWFHYGAPLMPLALGAAFEVLSRQRVREVLTYKRLAAATVVVLLLMSPLAVKGPRDYNWSSALYRNGSADYESLIASVPSGAVVSVDDRLVSHMSHRKTIYQFPEPFTDVGPQGAPFSARRTAQVQYVVVGLADVSGAEAHGFTQPVASSGNFVVLKRSQGG